MAFKINVSLKGKTAKFESDNESLIDTKLNSKIDGKEISSDLDGYELEITGTSDKAGFPGLKQFEGPGLKKALLKRGKGMKDTRKGIKLRKTVRGNAISLDTVQINTKVLKEGKKKFEDFLKKEEAPVQ
ncbi:MAG: S6e family ribosomal protein [Nanoarchaeota archaeon]